MRQKLSQSVFFETISDNLVLTLRQNMVRSIKSLKFIRLFITMVNMLQDVKPFHMEGRKSDGTFANGHKLATGRTASVFQGLSDRRSHYLTKFTRKQIIDIAASDEALEEFSSFDAKVLIGLADTLKRTPEDKLDPSKERERMYDRELGKASQDMNVDVNVKVHLAKRLDEAFEMIEAKPITIIDHE